MASLPLSALLSQVLVAFTLEFDNESEHTLRHRTTRYGSAPGYLHNPWLVSMVMWTNCMQFVGEQGVRVRDLGKLARTHTNLNGMERWGYVVVKPDPADSRPKPPRSDWIIQATPGGRKAQEIWLPLFGTIENRWQERFGNDEIDELRESLRAVISQIDIDLPDCLSILHYGLFSRAEYKPRAPEREDNSRLPLPALLSRVLLVFAIDFEGESDLSLAMSANAVRVLDDKGVRVRDLPRLTGVSKEAIAMSLSFLTKRGYARVESDPAGNRAKVARLTQKGRDAQDTYHCLVRLIEQRWQERFGRDTVHNLRESLEQFVGDSTPERSPLFDGLEPYPDGWRASVPKPSTLPHFPMVLHRGGYPDGS